jgi:hypothetical protein
VTEYSVLLYVHLLLFVYWLGADLGVFALALSLKNPRYSHAQRVLLMKMSLTIDMGPRMAMIAIAPIGLHLAVQSGLAAVPGYVFVFSWLIAALWIVGEWIAFMKMGQPVAIRFYIFNGVLMALVFLAATVFGISSLFTGWPFEPTWLALKVFLFGMVFLVSIMMAIFYAPIEGILDRLGEEGDSDSIEARIRTQVNKGAIFTVLLFALLAIIGFLGVAKPV